MSFRFQKRVRVAPGVRINFSKRGVSSSVGRRGASMTIGKRGLYGNAGIPGTGLSYRTKLNRGNSRKKSSMNQQRTGKPDAEKVQVNWDAQNNDLDFQTEDGRSLTDTEIRKVRSLHKEEIREIYEEKAKEINEKTDKLLDLHHHLFNQDKDLTNVAANSLTLSVDRPNRENIYHDIELEKKSTLSFFDQLKLFLPSKRKEFQEEVNKITDESFKEELRTFEEESTAIEEEKRYRMLLAKKVEQGDTEAMEEWLSLFLDEVDFPLETDVDFQIISDKKAYVDIDLPKLEDVPFEKARVLKTNRLKVENKTQRDHREDYAIMVGGSAFYLASFFFSYLPTLEEVVISGYNQVLDDSTGHDVDQYIYSLIIDRSTLNSMNMENVHPIKAFEHFSSIIDATKTYIFKEIEPYQP
ncbi:DUF4236 domain-containing protein [Bacillus shivajii]|uniref:DUF4236 domain-containing protein n=1 Tax=Bacillus shivajii TaxID=1983719 RepID=UPI001CFB15FA|nr:DUF4236 domain-containing protein [Bacillus shivajii]UCZ54646.1 DUF4236 domain-containing protein [Bacillus shivajii]